MALTYFGATSFAQSGPEQWRLGQFDLDQMSVPFSGAATGLTAFISSLTRGDAWSGDANMFLIEWSVSDSNKQYPTVTLDYLGAKGGVLPPAKIDYDDQVQSSSSSRSIGSAIVLTQPFVIQYYAPSTVYTWITAGAAGDPATDVPDPIVDTRVITLSTGDTTFNIGPIIQETVDRFFVPRTVRSYSAKELVRDAKYYQNEIRAVKVLNPWAYDLSPGPYLTLSNAGIGYNANNILELLGTSGHAELVVTAVGTEGITNWTVLNNTFTATELDLPAYGGLGHGARFNVVVLS